MQTLKLLFCSTLVFVLAGCNNDSSVYTQQLQEFNKVLEEERLDQLKYHQKASDILKVDVRRQGNSREGMERIQRTNLLNERIQWALDTLQLLKEKLSGKEATSTKPVRRLFWDNDGGRKLAMRINKDIKWLLNEYIDLNLVVSNDLIQREFALSEKYNLDKFTELHFAQGTVASTLALLNYWQMSIVWYQSEILAKLGAGDISADHRNPSIEGGITTKSDIIKLGETYEATIFVTSRFNYIHPRALLNSADIPLLVNNGQAEFGIVTKAIPDSIKANKITRYWEGSMTFKSRGRDTTLKVRMPYTVLRKSVYNPEKIKQVK